MRTFPKLLFFTCFLLPGVRHMAYARVQDPKANADFATITARSLRANLKFLSGDELKGRDTPSPELDIAAAWIASQFEGAGLEPGVSGSYYQMAAFRDKPVRNVIGVLPGSDPKLKDTYLIVSGHYDHLGTRGTEGDTIFNGANDNGSSIVSIVELAKSFGALKVRPKRSIVFMAFWGEEKGLQGAFYYGRNPVFPLAKTIGNLNLEQLGRTDDTEGAQVGRFAITGFDFSDMHTVLEAAGKVTGVKVDKRAQGDPYFMASDNAALAAVGIPAHTVSVSYEFPDYHKVSDSWEKIDYNNMAKIVQTVAVAINSMANSNAVPKWNPDNPRTKRYIEAAKKLNGGG